MALRVEAKSSMQERILSAADRLFYARGIQAVGVDLIAAEIGISKRTLYNHFASKGDLIVAYLERRNRPTPSPDLPPAERILAEFDRLERSFAKATFRGCPFINAVAELAQPDETVAEIALRFKEERRLWFRENLRQLEVADPDGLAMQLALLADGAVAAALVRGDPRVARAARDAAAVLLAAAGVVAATSTDVSGGRRRSPDAKRWNRSRR